MAKKTAPDVESLRKAVVGFFTKHSDRGTALVATAWVDDALEMCIRAALRPPPAQIHGQAAAAGWPNCEKMTDELFGSDAPLGTLSGRIKIAYLFDLIGP